MDDYTLQELLEDDKNMVCSYVVDNHTGEVITEVNEGDTLKVIRKGTKEFLTNYKRINKNKPFTFLYASAGEILCRENLTPNENRIIWGIQNHIEYSSGVLKMLRGCKPDKVLNANDIITICDMNPKTFYRAMDGLIKKRIIGKTKVGRETNYIVNPFIFYRGQCKGGGYVPATTYELFKTSKWNTDQE